MYMIKKIKVSPIITNLSIWGGTSPDENLTHSVALRSYAVPLRHDGWIYLFSYL